MSDAPFPRMLFVRQHLPDRRLPDVAGEVLRQMASSRIVGHLRAGARVAVGVGSRGIHDNAVVTGAVVRYLKERGLKPFIFPAMGSHGAATAQGQADVLARYGISEPTMGCPVVSQLEVVPLGRTPDGIETFMDREAFESDGVLLVNRVKWHTAFSGKLESGLMKMMAIGLGKFAGAQRYHVYAYKLGLEHVIRSVGRRVLKSGKVLGGVAICEDAHHHTGKIDVLRAEEMERREEEDLALVKSWMARIPTDLDILVIDEIGKDVSGGGMDGKIVNRNPLATFNPYPDQAKIERIFVRGLSAVTHGNGIGLGLADVVTDRLVAAVDWRPTYANAFTSLFTATIQTPAHFPTDRECLQRLLPTVGRIDLRDVTIGWIHNSLELGVLGVSEQLRPVVERNPQLEILGPPCELEFDPDGNLVDLLGAHAHRAV